MCKKFMCLVKIFRLDYGKLVDFITTQWTGPINNEATGSGRCFMEIYQLWKVAWVVGFRLSVQKCNLIGNCNFSGNFGDTNFSFCAIQRQFRVLGDTSEATHSPTAQASWPEYR